MEWNLVDTLLLSYSVGLVGLSFVDFLKERKMLPFGWNVIDVAFITSIVGSAALKRLLP